MTLRDHFTMYEVQRQLHNGGLNISNLRHRVHLYNDPSQLGGIERCSLILARVRGGSEPAEEKSIWKRGRLDGHGEKNEQHSA